MSRCSFYINSVKHVDSESNPLSSTQKVSLRRETYEVNHIAASSPIAITPKSNTIDQLELIQTIPSSATPSPSKSPNVRVTIQTPQFDSRGDQLRLLQDCSRLSPLNRKRLIIDNIKTKGWKPLIIQSLNKKTEAEESSIFIYNA